MHPAYIHLNVEFNVIHHGFQAYNFGFSDPHISTVPQNGKPTTPTNHNNLKSKGFGPIPGSLLPFVGGAIAGLIVLSIILLIVIYCRKQCKIK